MYNNEGPILSVSTHAVEEKALFFFIKPLGIKKESGPLMFFTDMEILDS